MAANFLNFFVVIVALVPGVVPECKEMAPAGLMTEWFVKPRTWFTPMADETSQSELFAVIPKSLASGGTNNLCWVTTFAASGVPLGAPIGYACTYGHSANEQVCTKSESSQLDHTVFQNWPQQLAVKIVATDNSTYALVAGCFGGQLDTWALMSMTAEPSSDAKQIAESLFPKRDGAKAASFRVGSTEILECGKNSLGLNAFSRFTKKQKK